MCDQLIDHFQIRKIIRLFKYGIRSSFLILLVVGGNNKIKMFEIGTKFDFSDSELSNITKKFVKIN